MVKRIQLACSSSLRSIADSICDWLIIKPNYDEQIVGFIYDTWLEIFVKFSVFEQRSRVKTKRQTENPQKKIAFYFV